MLSVVAEAVEAALECLNDGSPIRATAVLEQLFAEFGNDEDFIYTDEYYAIQEAMDITSEGGCYRAVNILERLL